MRGGDEEDGEMRSRASCCLSAGRMNGKPPSLSPFIFSLSSSAAWSCLALAFTPAPACMCVCECVCAWRETSFIAAGIYYNPNKRSRLIVYELPAFQSQQRPLFSQKTPFSFQLHLITRAKKIKKASPVPQGFIPPEKLSLLLFFSGPRQMGFQE